MIRPLIYFMIIIIIFLVGFIAGIERDATEQSTEFQQINTEEQIVSEEQLLNIDSSSDSQAIFHDDNNRLLSKFANVCETITHKFYQMIILILYSFSEMFI